MKRTRLSLFYLIGYLIPGGLGLLIDPRLALRLLLSTGEYGDVMPRLVGMMMLALGTIVLQAVRHHVDVLFPTAVAVRSVMLPILLSLYFLSRDPLFITLFVIVGIGVALTGVSLWLDTREQA